MLIKYKVISSILDQMYQADDTLDLLPDAEINRRIKQMVDEFRFNEAEFIKLLHDGITELSLKDTLAEDSTIFKVIRLCPRLEQINIYGCHITDNALEVLSKNISGLKGLKMATCRKITDKGMTAVATLSGLQELDIRYCSQISGEGIEQVAKGCPELRSLRLGVHRRLVTNKAVKAIAANLSRLEELELSAINISNSGVAKLTALTRLRSLTITGCLAISDKSMMPVVQACKNLEILVIRSARITGATLYQAALNCPRLWKLNIGNCEDVNDMPFSKLSLLSITEVDILGCRKLTDTAIKFLAQAPLRILVMANCELTDESLIALEATITLEQLWIQRCSGISEYAKLSLVRARPQLDIRS